LFESLEDFVSEVEVVYHSVVVWAEADEVFWGVVLFIGVDVVDVDDFVEVADCALFCDFSEGFEVDVVGFSLVVCFVFVEMENVIVAASAEAFGVDVDFPFASFACCDFWLPFEFFVAGITEALGVVFFFFVAVDAFFYHVSKWRSYIKNLVQTGYFRSLCNGRTTYNVYCANFFEIRVILRRLCKHCVVVQSVCFVECELLFFFHKKCVVKNDAFLI